jgi:hypothetical protein
VTAPTRLLPSRELDPLSTAAIGTALAGVASLVWPQLVAGAVSLAAVASFVLWIRAVRALRRRRSTGYHPSRLLPFLAVGAAGWAVALVLDPAFPAGRALVLGVVIVALWVLARSAWSGI